MVRHACQFIFVALKLTHSHFKTNWLAVVKCHEILEITQSFYETVTLDCRCSVSHFKKRIVEPLSPRYALNITENG